MLWKKQSRARWRSGGQAETSLPPQPLYSMFHLLSYLEKNYSPHSVLPVNHCTIISDSFQSDFFNKLSTPSAFTFSLPSYSATQSYLVSAPTSSLKLLPKSPFISMLPNPVEMNPNFDTFEHSFLLEKCPPLGFHYIALSCLPSYFSVSTDSYTTSDHPLNACVPLDSIPVPSFLILSGWNQSFTVISITIYILMTLNFYIQPDLSPELQNHISNCLLVISTWMAHRHLKQPIQK